MDKAREGVLSARRWAAWDLGLTGQEQGLDMADLSVLDPGFHISLYN